MTTTRCPNFSNAEGVVLSTFGVAGAIGGVAWVLFESLPDGPVALSETDRERSGGVGIEVEGTTGGGMEGLTRACGMPTEGTIGGVSKATVGSEIGRAVCRVVNGLELAAVGRVGLGFNSETGDPCKPSRGDDGIEDGPLWSPDKRPTGGRREMCGRDPELGSATTGLENVPNAAGLGGRSVLVCSAEMSDACMTSVTSRRGLIEGGAGTVSDSLIIRKDLSVLEALGARLKLGCTLTSSTVVCLKREIVWNGGAVGTAVGISNYTQVVGSLFECAKPDRTCGSVSCQKSMKTACSTYLTGCRSALTHCFLQILYHVKDIWDWLPIRQDIFVFVVIVPDY